LEAGAGRWPGQEAGRWVVGDRGRALGRLVVGAVAGVGAIGGGSKEQGARAVCGWGRKWGVGGVGGEGQMKGVSKGRGEGRGHTAPPPSAPSSSPLVISALGYHYPGIRRNLQRSKE